MENNAYIPFGLHNELIVYNFYIRKSVDILDKYLCSNSQEDELFYCLIIVDDLSACHEVQMFMERISE